MQRHGTHYSKTHHGTGVGDPVCNATPTCVPAGEWFITKEMAKVTCEACNAWLVDLGRLVGCDLVAEGA